MQCKNRGPRFLPDVSPNVSRFRRSEWSWQQSCLVRHKEATTTTTGSPATEAATSDPEAERQRLSAERLDLGGGGAWHGWQDVWIYWSTGPLSVVILCNMLLLYLLMKKWDDFSTKRLRIEFLPWQLPFFDSTFSWQPWRTPGASHFSAPAARSLQTSWQMPTRHCWGCQACMREEHLDSTVCKCNCFSPPARWGSLDFDKGAAPSFSSSHSASSGCSGWRRDPHTMSPAPETVEGSWTWTLYCQLRMLWGTPAPKHISENFR